MQVFGSDERFSAWIPLEEAGALPEAPGVLQVKIAPGLVAYPRGRSAMVLYAGVPDLRAFALAQSEAIAAQHRTEGETLLVRHRRTPAYEALAAELLGRFAARFGSVPVLNRFYSLRPQ